MQIKVVSVGEVVERPSLLFKPYSVKWGTKVIFGSWPHEKIVSLTMKKYFQDAIAAVKFRDNMCGKVLGSR